MYVLERSKFVLILRCSNWIVELLGWCNSTPAISTLTTKVANLNPVHDEVYSIHYVIKFASGLQQGSCFLRVLRFCPPIKITTTI